MKAVNHLSVASAAAPANKGIAPHAPAARDIPDQSVSAASVHIDLGNESKDHFIVRDGMTFAGTHLIIDLWDARHLDDIPRMEQAFRDAVRDCKATLLHIHMHHFQPNGGISGVAVLAESHISVHTWPERNYAAFDLFMCGDSEPHKAIPIFEKAFAPGRVVVSEHLRGRVDRTDERG
jgi:S-adenosylmethionine decarboxylase